jgi:hypothetical protein
VLPLDDEEEDEAAVVLSSSSPLVFFDVLSSSSPLLLAAEAMSPTGGVEQPTAIARPARTREAAASAVLIMAAF